MLIAPFQHQLGQAVATQQEEDSSNVAALIQSLRTEIQTAMVNTAQATAAQQAAEILCLKQEFETLMKLSANIINQLTNKLTQLDTQTQDTRIRGWMDGQAGPSGYQRGSSLPPVLPRPPPLRQPSPAAPVVPAPPPPLPPAPPVVPVPVAPAAPARSMPKDPKILAPSRFTGKSSELQNFLFAMREYFQIKVNELPDEPARLAFLTAMLSGSALDWWGGVRATITTHENALRRLEEDFGDPMIDERAYREISKLRQGNLTISEYINKVERLNLHAGLDRNVLLKVMKDNIKPEIAMAIATSPYDYPDYQTWKVAILRIGTQLDYVKSKQLAHRLAQSPNNRQRHTEPSTHQPRQNQTQRNFNPTPRSDVMVPPAVKDQRAKDGLYVKCGRKHPTKECRTNWALFMTETPATTPQQNKDPRPHKRSGKRKAESDSGEGSSKKQEGEGSSKKQDEKGKRLRRLGSA